MEVEIGNDKLKQLHTLLEKYDEKILLNKLYVPDVRLDLRTSDIAKMTTEELNIWRLEIAQYLLFLQKQINKHKSIVNWSDAAYRLYIGTKALNYSAFSFEERKMQAADHDNYAKELNMLKMTSQAFLDRMDFLPPKIAALSDIARDIIWARKREDYHESRS